MADVADLEPVDDDNIARWPNGMVGGAINNAARALEGILARWFADTNGSVTASGSSNAFAITTNRATALADNQVDWFTANHTITGAATLNRNGAGAKSIKRFNGNDLTQGDIVSGQPVGVIYKSSPDCFFMVSAAAALFANMHADFNENASPGDPAANVARLYSRDDGSSTTELVWRDSAGVISVLKQATAANMEAAAADRLVAASLQHRHPGHPKAWGRASSAGSLVSGSYNVASVVQNSTGNYTVTLTNAMANTNYLPQATIVGATTHLGAMAVPATASTFTVSTFATHVDNVPQDAAFGFTVLGDM